MHVISARSHLGRTLPAAAPRVAAARGSSAGSTCVRALVVGIMGLVLGQPAQAAEKMRFWNTTSVELDQVFLAPAGTGKWGPNQCLNDDDKTVQADERLTLEGVSPGLYDVKLRDVRGRTCFARNIEIHAGGKYAFAIEDRELTDCTVPDRYSCSRGIDTNTLKKP